MAVLLLENPREVAASALIRPGAGEQLERLVWMIRLRWWAIAAIASLASGAGLAGVTQQTPQLLALALGLLIANALFARVTRTMTSATPCAAIEDLLALQISVDITVLLGALHLAGGADNPFILLSLVLLALAAIVLPLARAISIAVAASLMYVGMIAAEAVGVLPHNALQLGQTTGPHGGAPALWQSPTYLLGLGLAHLGSGLSVQLLVATLVRTIRVAERTLREQQAIAEQRERLARVGALVSGVAHTIRNPLHGMMSCVDMLQRDHARSPQASAEILELLGEGVARIASVTKRLLTLARETPTAPGSTDVAALLHDAVRSCEFKSRERSIDVELNAAPELAARLWVCPDRLTEAITNIIDNAIDASTTGGKVTVSAALCGKRGVQIIVHDCGTGIAEADLPHIFEPFFTTKAIGEGTGLGLAITRQVVEDYGGELRVASQAGEGTTVTIHFAAYPMPGSP